MNAKAYPSTSGIKIQTDNLLAAARENLSVTDDIHTGQESSFHANVAAKLNTPGLDGLTPVEKMINEVSAEVLREMEIEREVAEREAARTQQEAPEPQESE